MNALQTGIDAQSQIITGEDPEALERLAAQYHDRFQPQGPEEVALIASAVSADWLLRRLRKTEAELWNRSTSDHAANLFKWGEKAEEYPLAAAFQDKQKVFDRLQRRISAAERSLRASLDTLARLRKVPVGPAILSSANAKVGRTLPPGNLLDPSHPQAVVPNLPVTPSDQTANPEIGFVPEISRCGKEFTLCGTSVPPTRAECSES